ncbi:MAG: GAF domain-containing protein [Desulfobacteraceae bacterium]|nr:GAF domain-containing protein [Desulfobacteraceae bacterium]
MSDKVRINIDMFKTVSKAISQSDNLDIIANHLTQLIVTTLGVKGCAIFVLEPELKELELLASFGLTPKYLTKGSIRADKTFAANLEGKALLVPDVSKDKNIQYPEEAKKEGIKAILSVPIVFLNEVLGALRLYHYEVWNISEHDLDSLYLLAENIGLAMTYTRLKNAIHSICEVIGMACPDVLLGELEKR